MPFFLRSIFLQLIVRLNSVPFLLHHSESRALLRGGAGRGASCNRLLLLCYPLLDSIPFNFPRPSAPISNTTCLLLAVEVDWYYQLVPSTPPNLSRHTNPTKPCRVSSNQNPANPLLYSFFFAAAAVGWVNDICVGGFPTTMVMITRILAFGLMRISSLHLPSSSNRLYVSGDNKISCRWTIPCRLILWEAGTGSYFLFLSAYASLMQGNASSSRPFSAGALRTMQEWY